MTKSAQGFAGRLSRVLMASVAILSCVLIGTASAAPRIFWLDDSGAPGDTVMLIGASFGANPTVQLLRIPENHSGKPGDLNWERDGVSAEITQSRPDSIKFLRPKSLPMGITAVRVSDGQSSTDARLNAPVVFWSQGDAGENARPGGWIRSFGKSLGGSSNPTRLELVSLSAKNRFVIAATRANAWEAEFHLPVSLPADSYRARIHNGWGGEAGWSQFKTMVIATPASDSWPKTVFDARAFGAKGDGVADDTQAVTAALEAAGRNGGGVVFFSRGRYRLASALLIPPKVTLRGRDRALSALLWDEFRNPPPVLLRGFNRFAIEDLSVYTSNYVHVIGSDLESTPAGEPGDVRLERLLIRAVRYRGRITADDVDRVFRETYKYSDFGDAIALGGTNIRIVDCDVYASGRSLFLFKPKGAYVKGNLFFNGRYGWYSISGADGVIFEDNEIQGADLMASGGGINNLRGPRASQNVWFSRNKLSLFHGGDREAMTSDAGGGFYYGNVSGANADSFLILDGAVPSAPKSGSWTGAGIFILSGLGAGQYRQVLKVDGNRVRVDAPWQVIPDETSIITITSLQRRYFFVDNDFRDAGVAIQFYGTSVEHVVTGNKSSRAGSIYNSGRWYQHYQPSWFNLFEGNEIIDGNVYRGGPNNATFAAEAFIGTHGLQKAPNPAPLALGNIIRGNRLRGNAHIEVIGVDAKAPGVQDMVVENNVVENASVGLRIDSGVRGLVARRNTFRNVDVPIEDASPPGSGTNIER